MQLKDYIQGDRRGKSANRLEREAMTDPFLQDALDGFDTVAGNHGQIIDRLEKKIFQPDIAPHRNRRLFLYWSAAASILLLVGFSVYFFLERTDNTIPAIAMLQPDEIENENEQVVSPDSSVSQSAPKEELLKMPAVAKNIAPTQTRSITPLELSELSTSYEDEIKDQVVSDVVVVEENFAASTEKAMARGEQPRQTIRGKVVDVTGAPLPGASIVVKGTSTGTITDISGNFEIQAATDSQKLIASFVGYEIQVIEPSDKEQTVTLKESDVAISEVVIVGYGVQKKTSRVGAVSTVNDRILTPSATFGEKEFKKYCQEKADKNICSGKGAVVKLSFFIDETGKPVNIEYQKYSCEGAKKEIENLLSSSPVWTTTNRKVSMTIKW
jgi:hypothetical protein